MQITPGTPGKGHERAGFGAVGQEFIEVPNDVLARDLITAAFLALVINQGLSVSETNIAPRACAHGEFGVRRGQMRLVNQQSGGRVRGNFQSALGEISENLNPGRTHEMPDWS